MKSNGVWWNSWGFRTNGILWVPWDSDTKIFSNIIIPKIHKPISPIQGIPVKEWIQAAHDHPSTDVTQSLAEMSDAISHQPTSLAGLLRCHVKQLIY